MSLMLPEKFQHILRIVGTNIDGKRKVMFAMTAIKGVGRRYANIVLKNADVNLDKRAGECSEEEVITDRSISQLELLYSSCLMGASGLPTSQNLDWSQLGKSRVHRLHGKRIGQY
ncbi:unnamed protein product [Nesidiocoris tenuis]|uniref:Small ribosomal subunit protein uS13 n=1 Tax=Nesidiocoris tenuis TaxID=355587 RepID=A0A6H5HI34_9HEMI|nr:unnamed protein product [Nesidiocoris tenuis]